MEGLCSINERHRGEIAQKHIHTVNNHTKIKRNLQICINETELFLHNVEPVLHMNWRQDPENQIRVRSESAHSHIQQILGDCPCAPCSATTLIQNLTLFHSDHQLR